MDKKEIREELKTMQNTLSNLMTFSDMYSDDANTELTEAWDKIQLAIEKL